MNDEHTELQADRQQLTDDRQAWQRPILKRLQVNLDTAYSGLDPFFDGVVYGDISGV